jgi:ribosomal protein L28
MNIDLVAERKKSKVKIQNEVGEGSGKWEEEQSNTRRRFKPENVVKSDWQPVTGRPVALENCCALKLIF